MIAEPVTPPDETFSVYSDADYPNIPTVDRVASVQRNVGGTGASDANDGILVSAGGTGPWATFEYALQQLFNPANGITVLNIRGTVTVSADFTTQNYGAGIGTYADRVWIRGIAGTSPTIQCDGVPTFEGQSYLLLWGFDIAGDKGLRFGTNSVSDYVTCRNLTGIMTGIGGDNLGKIRVHGAGRNEAFGAFNCRFIGPGTTGTHHNTSGIIIFTTDKFRIENCELRNFPQNIYVKHTNPGAATPDVHVRHNWCHGEGTALITMNGVGGVAEIENNLFDCDLFIDNGGGGIQPNSITIKHNTVTQKLYFKEGNNDPINCTLTDNVILGNFELLRYAPDAPNNNISNYNVYGGSIWYNGSSYTLAQWQASSVPAGQDANSFAGTPVFNGGVTPTTIEGWAIASGAGKGSASDGGDRGVDITKVGTKIAAQYLPVLGTGQVYEVATTGNDTNDGIPVAQGGTGPWATIQHAAQTLVAGETVQIRGGTYSEPEPINGSSYWYGIRPLNNGTAGEPITYMAYPGETVIIDQGVNGVPQDNNGVWGISILGKKYLNFIGLEIRNCWRAGIETFSGFGVENEEIYIHRCNIHNIRFSDAQNTAAIRNDFVNGLYVTDCEIHDVYTSGTQHHNCGAFLSYMGRNLVAQNNHIYDTYAVIFQKKFSEINPSPCFTFKRNIVHNVHYGWYTNNNESTPASCYGFNALVEQNIIYDIQSQGAVTFDTAHDAVSQSYGYIFRNNTIIGSPGRDWLSGIRFRGWRNIQCYNNVIYANGGTDVCDLRIDYGDAQEATDGSGDWMPGLDFCDYNLYSIQPNVLIGGSSSTPNSYTSLTAWQAAPTDGSVPGLDVTTSPDINSIVATPSFVDSGNNDWRLDVGSPGLGVGMGGVNMGAQPTGAEVIGVRP